MHKIMSLLICLSVAGKVNAQDCVALSNNFSMNQNYVVMTMPRVPMSTFSATGKTSCDLIQSVQYFDGLGRPLQTVQVKGSPGNKDLVQPFMYDAFGREAQKSLSYTAIGADGSYKSDALTTGATNFYYPGGTAPSGSQQANGIVYNPRPYAITNFEPSPLNRVIEQGAAGPDWQPVPGAATGHTIKMGYEINNLNAFSGADTAVSRRVTLYNAVMNSDQSRTLTIGNTAGNYYLAGQLTVTVSKDENWKSGRGGTIEEYRDKDGHVLLKRTFTYAGGALQQLSTYYVYDDLGNLSFALPPMSGADAGITSAANQTALNSLCYQYQYDSRNRLVQKRLPGKEWEYIVYNKLDQQVATQDGNQRSLNQWIITKYDGQGRVSSTGAWNNGGTAITRSSLQSTVTSFIGPLWENRPAGGYPTNTAWPTTGLQGNLTVNYYDDYTAPDLPYTKPAAAISLPLGMLTCTKSWVLGSTAVLFTEFFYDGLGRNFETFKQHYLAGTTAAANPANYDDIANTYDFSNNVTTTTRRHYTTAGTTAAAVTVTNTYSYDHMNRKTQTWESIYNGNNAPPAAVLLSQLDYNELGQLKIKHLHSENSGSTYLQSVGYRYNERSWLQSSLSDGNLFNQNLYYNQPTDVTFSKQYNGNIAELTYTKTGVANVVFKYGYDLLNRLTSGTATGGSTLGEQLTYDLMSNIKTLTRTGPIPATLVYTYYNSNNSNQLQMVTNNSAAFRSYGTYDANGNAPGDGGGKTITYNILNLPKEVKQGNTTLATYIYDASGDKLSTTGSDGRWDYIGGIVYNGSNAASEAIQFIQTEEGRATPNGSAWNYSYNLNDHLGNVRVSFDKNPSTGAARRIQEDEYYPFGLRNTFYNLSNNNRYLYNGKELQTDLTSQYDYGARFYDPVIARWTSVDPMAEKDQKSSPYNYGFNNPISFIDPDGMFGDYYTESGQWLGTDNKDDDKAYVAKEGSYKKQDNGYAIKKSKITELKIGNKELLEKAATIYGESSAYKTNGMTDELKKEMFAIASVHERNDVAYGGTSELADLFAKASPNERNYTKKQSAIAAEINAQTGGFDYSYGASNWDGIEQAAFKKTDTRYSTGRFELHKNTIGWSISDGDYKAWKSYAKQNGYGFNAPQVSKSVGGTYHRNGSAIKITGGNVGFNSTAVYGGTIFWKQ
ncbi:MAG: DUF6443 domain-containing protein [Bacteroidota bacterium]